MRKVAGDSEADVEPLDANQPRCRSSPTAREGALPAGHHRIRIAKWQVEKNPRYLMLDLIFIDLIVLLTCMALLAWKGRLSHSHPAVIYLIFHFSS